MMLQKTLQVVGLTIAIFVLPLLNGAKAEAFPLKPVLRDVGRILLDAALGGGTSNQGDSTLNEPLNQPLPSSQDSYQFLQPESTPATPATLAPQAFPQPSPQFYPPVAPGFAPAPTYAPGYPPMYPGYPSQQYRQPVIIIN